MAARRTAGDLSANAICISSSGLPPLLRRSASSAARRTCCEASFFSIASSAGAAPAAPLLAGRLGQRDLHLFGGVGRHRRQHPLDGGPRRGAVARRRRRRLRGERRQVEAVDAIERRGRGPHAEDRHRLDAQRLGPLDVGGERGHAIDRVARADAQVGVQGAAQIRLAGERRVGQRRGQRRHRADDRAVVVDGAGRVGRDRRVGVLEEPRRRRRASCGRGRRRRPSAPPASRAWTAPRAPWRRRSRRARWRRRAGCTCRGRRCRPACRRRRRRPACRRCGRSPRRRSSGRAAWCPSAAAAPSAPAPRPSRRRSSAPPAPGSRRPDRSGTRRRPPPFEASLRASCARPHSACSRARPPVLLRAAASSAALSPRRTRSNCAFCRTRMSACDSSCAISGVGALREVVARAASGRPCGSRCWPSRACRASRCGPCSSNPSP